MYHTRQYKIIFRQHCSGRGPRVSYLIPELLYSVSQAVRFGDEASSSAPPLWTCALLSVDHYLWELERVQVHEEFDEALFDREIFSLGDKGTSEQDELRFPEKDPPSIHDVQELLDESPAVPWDLVEWRDVLIAAR